MIVRKLMVLVFLQVSVSGAAKYAGEFLSVGAGARGLGMGGAFCAVVDDASSGYWNPSSLFRLRNQQVQLMHSERFGGLVKYDYMGYGRSDGETGLGAGLYRTAIGDIPNTNNLEWYDTGSDGVFGEDGAGVPGDAGDDDYDPASNPDGTEGNNEWDPGEEIIYDESRITYESAVDWALYLSWSRSLNERLSVGASTKLISRNLMGYSAFGLGLDIGARYDLSGAFSAGINLQDVFGTHLFWNNGASESILPTVKAGAAIKWPVSKFATLVTVAMDGDFRFEGRKYSAQYNFAGVSLDTHLGMEFLVKETVALRLGSSEGSMTAGTGIGFGLFGRRVMLDYAYLGHDVLENTHRISLGVDF